MNQKIKIFVILVVSTILLAACGGGGSNNTNFPLPAKVSNFSGEGGDAPINFTTTLSIDEVVTFYRDAFTTQGLTERTLNTSITETTVNLVFDGHTSGQAVVVQAVDLGNGSTNVNIRLETI